MPRWSVWLRVIVLVLALVIAGLVLIALSTASTAPRETGIALTTGGVTGFVFLVVQSVVGNADERERLLLRLSATQDLTGIDLRGRSLEKLTLVGKVMPVADLSDAAFCDARFVGADLRWATLRRSQVRDTTFAHASLDYTDLRDARFTGVDLRRATFSDARLAGAVLDNVDLAGADLAGAHLEGCTFRRVHYDHATAWPAGYPLPPDDPTVTDMHRGQPPWDDYWAKLGRKARGAATRPPA